MSAPDTVMVLAASYPGVASAEADYEAVKALYQRSGRRMTSARAAC
jgi:hypothetical protein